LKGKGEIVREEDEVGIENERRRRERWGGGRYK